MEGYINSAFSGSQLGLSRLWNRQRNVPPVTPAVEPADPDTDLDMDSFLSDLEKDSGRRGDSYNGSFVNVDLGEPEALKLRYRMWRLY